MPDQYISEEGRGVRPLSDIEADAFSTALRASLDSLDLLDRVNQRLQVLDEAGPSKPPCCGRSSSYLPASSRQPDDRR